MPQERVSAAATGLPIDTTLMEAISILQMHVMANDSKLDGKGVWGACFMPMAGIEAAIAKLIDVLEEIDAGACSSRPQKAAAERPAFPVGVEPAFGHWRRALSTANDPEAGNVSDEELDAKILVADAIAGRITALDPKGPREVLMQVLALTHDGDALVDIDKIAGARVLGNIRAAIDGSQAQEARA